MSVPVIVPSAKALTSKTVIFVDVGTELLVCA